MEQNFLKKYYNAVCDIISDKSSLFVIVFITIAAFGFEITHFALGIDDFAVRHYLSSGATGSMLQQGRLLHIAVYYLTGLVDVIPYLNNLLAASLFSFSGVLLMALIDVMSDFHFSKLNKLLFFCIYVSYPIMAFKFIYDLDVFVVGISYVCVTLSVVFGFSFIESKKKIHAFYALILLFISIGGYETFNAVYVCTVLFCIILASLYCNKKTSELFRQGLVMAGFLIVALVLYYSTVILIQKAFKVPPYPRGNIFSLDISFVRVCISIIKKMMNINFLFSTEFCIAAFVLGLLAIYFSFKKKSFFLLLLFFSFGFFQFATNILQGFLLYRSCQAANLFIAAVVLFIGDLSLKKSFIYKGFVLFTTFLLLWQLKEINLFFYKDWANYQKNVYAIHEIATSLQKNYNVKDKPVCFVNRDYNSYLMSWDESSMQTEIGESPIVASIGFLGVPSSPTTIQLFEYQEYNFIKQPTDEQAKAAAVRSNGMPAYPKEGYIKEYDDFIIVNMGEVK